MLLIKKIYWSKIKNSPFSIDEEYFTFELCDAENSQTIYHNIGKNCIILETRKKYNNSSSFVEERCFIKKIAFYRLPRLKWWNSIIQKHRYIFIIATTIGNNYISGIMSEKHTRLSPLNNRQYEEIMDGILLESICFINLKIDDSFVSEKHFIDDSIKLINNTFELTI